MPTRYQGLVFHRGRGRGRERGRGRIDNAEPFSDTEPKVRREGMDQHNEEEQPRQRDPEEILDKLLRENQQMVRQGQVMMDLMQQVMGLHVGARPDGAAEPHGDGGSRAGGSRTYQLPHTP